MVEDVIRSVSHLDIDRSWHAIHFLLNGDAWEGEPPLVNAVMGGMPIGEEEIGYGPARFLCPEEVGSVANAMVDISKDQRLEKFDPEGDERRGNLPARMERRRG